MSFAAPLWLAAAAAVALGLVVAHLFSTSVPPRDYLPTVRFVPEGAPLAVMRTRRLSDIPLLLLRLLAVALLGMALAGVHLERRGPPRVLVVDASRAVRSFVDVRDSARAIGTDGATLVAFDATARRIPADSLESMAVSQSRGSLSAALVAAHRSLTGATDGRERTELVVVSPVVREEVDSATRALLDMWAGPIRHVRVAAAETPALPHVSLGAVGDDPVAAIIASSSLVIPSAARDLQLGVRIMRTSPTRADSLWARDSGGALVVWPADVRSPVLARRESADTTNGIAAGQHVVVASFARTQQPSSGRAIARWIDGEVAATEAPLGIGCVREVAIPVDPVGDISLRESFRGVVGALTEPCGGARDFTASPLQIPRSARDDTRARDDGRTPMTGLSQERIGTLAMWLGAFALAILVAEQFLRARARSTA